MKYLSGSQNSPFNEGFKSNLSYVFFNKSYRENDDKYIDWKKRILQRYQHKSKIDNELKNI